ncbi:MAG: AI-2E family transporter [Desulfobacterales bacterium]|nr:MAG: AI-2E family transporter [Desulfobacterales bacterium]
MKNEKLNRIVLILLVALISGIFILMIRRFLMPIFMAGLFSAMARPIHRWLAKHIGGRETAASVLTVLGVVVLVIGPLSLLVTVVAAQAITVGQKVTPFIQTLIAEPTVISTYLLKMPYYDEIMPYRDLILEKTGVLVGNLSTFLIDSLHSFTMETVNAVFGSIIMLYVMFYFLTMGDRLLVKILYFLPLHDADEQKLLVRFTSVTRATIKGTMIIGLLQGIICGIAFAIVGIEGPVFWGTLMAVMSVIPAFGTAIIWAPAMIVTALLGNFGEALILLAICGGIAGNIDNVVRPRLVGKDTEMHDLFILFSTLGGISLFGILGIIIGPIIAALFITIWEIYGEAFRDFLPDVAMDFDNNPAGNQSAGDNDDPPSAMEEDHGNRD